MTKKKQQWFELEQREDLEHDARSLNATHNVVWGRLGGPILVNHRPGLLVSAVRFMLRVIRTPDVAFRTEVKNGRKRAVAASTLSRYFDILGGMAQVYSRHCQYSPLLQLFFDCFTGHDIQRCTLTGPDRQFEDGRRIEAEVFIDFVDTLREQGARIGIVKKLNDWNNVSDENDRNVQRYVDALFERYPVLVPIYLDLFSKDCRIEEERVEDAASKVEAERAADMAALRTSATGEVKSQEPMEHYDLSGLIAARDRLLENMRAKPSIFRSMVGYVWRIEWSYAGFYLRVVFLFDGIAPMIDAQPADLIGQYWVDAITKGRGTFRHQNSWLWNQPDVDAIAPHHVTKRMNLIHALRRLARRDRYVCVKAEQKCKRFGMGRQPQKVMSEAAKEARRLRLKRQAALAPGWVQTALRGIGNSSSLSGSKGWSMSA
ncbi:hypothetical protein [Ralstonia pickettii]|uniref:hypothetical protein n=1 Tax=Ralstonia pickettii TaxID=329 RepID=UPI0015BC5B31|nr:hypothetical protein [Ralstonia pickettii]NWK43320.1 hypothetical protein [Ralstonia pickettii]